MRPDLRKTGIKTMNDYASRLMKRYPQSEEYIAQVDLEEDRRVTRNFRFLVVVALIIWIVMTIARGNYSFTMILLYLCVSFVLCFTVLGMFVCKRISKGPLPGWVIPVNAVVSSVLMVLIGETSGNLHFLEVTNDILMWFGIDLGWEYLLIISLIGLSLVMTFAIIGVMYVTSAYLRRHLPSLYVYILKDAYRGKTSAAESFFMIPDFVDVKDVVVDPEIDYKKFSAEVAFDIWMYIMIMGMIISSYLFLNPYFLETMTSKDMLYIAFMLGMFVPCLIFPWIVIRDTNAHIITDAPRPYYLWNGAKRRLFGSFITLSAFTMLLLLSLYYGYSLTDIIIRYLYLVVPLACIAFSYSVLYTNNFRNTMMVAIYTRFYEKLNKFKSEQDEE